MEKSKNPGTTILERVKTDKKFCAALIGGAAVVVVVIVALIAALGGGGSTPGSAGGTEDGNSGGAAGTYSVSVETKGGMAMTDIDVAVYSDKEAKDLLDYATTDEEGMVSLDLTEADDYYIVLSGVPNGYEVEDSYSFEGTSAEIVLASSLITGEDISTAQLGLGDVMYDFTVTTSDGETFTLSEVLKEKEMVMLNFWYTTCSWCITEFPLMAEAYETYKDDIEIIALDPYPTDTVDGIKTFKEQHNLPFPMAQCPISWSTTFGISGYPTSVFIDQYGVICAVEAGAITSLRPFICAFDHFTADDYQQKLCENGVADLVTQVKPTYTMPSSDEIAATINGGDINVAYRAEEGESGEYTWPFVIGEKNGEKCIYASNKGIEEAYAILYADVELKAGQAVAFDYLVSSEKASDVMVVIVNGEDIYQMSGVDEVETWKSCYPWVAEEDGTYELALCYLKDESTNEGDDTVYVKNMRVVDAGAIDAATYLPRYAATEKEDGSYEYVNIVYNSADGYYHVGSADGPLLLADLMNYTKFNEAGTVYDMVYDDAELMINGVNRFEDLEQYCNYASNSRLTGTCPVTQDLYEMLVEFGKQYGFEDDENEWLRICKYYAAYGTSTQLEDPIKGLAAFCAYDAKLGSGNSFYYETAIIPRGMFAEFTPSKSGVYRITSQNDSVQGVDGWIFNENREELLVYERDERMFTEEGEVSMVYYMEAGKPYYINIAFWDVYEVGTINYTIEYVAPTYNLFRLASPGYFTYNDGATGDAMYYVISGGIDVVLGEDGIYYEDLGNGQKGSKLYVDFTGITSIFSNPIMTNQGVKGMIDMGGFDFSKTENDMYVLSVLESNNNDIAAAEAYLKELWGENYDAYAEEYQLEDVFAGRYHGDGEDYTETIRAYCNQIDQSGNTERNGCVVVTQELAEILQMVMEKYTFENVDHAWTKLCYYYDYLGPEN